MARLNKHILWITLLSGVLTYGHVEAAQNNIGDIIGSTMDQVERMGGLEKMSEDLAVPQEQIAPLEAKVLEEEAPGADSLPTFQLNEVSLKGNTAIPLEILEGHWKDLLNQSVSFQDIKTLSDKITAEYRKRGYVLSFCHVPEQTVKGGLVQLEVVEGYIDQVVVTFEDEKMTMGKTLAKLVKKLEQGRPLSEKTYERYLLLIRDLYPDAKGYLKPSKDHADGAGTLRLVIPKRSSKGFSFGINNFGSDSIGPWMGSVAIDRPSPLNEEHQMEVRYSQGNYQSELWSAGFGYVIPLNGEGTRFGIDLDTVRSRPGGDISEFDTLTRENEASVFLMHAFKRSQEANIYGNLEFEVTNQSRYIRLLDDVKKERSRRIKASFIAQWQDGLHGGNYVNLTAVQGMRLWNAVSQSYENRTRRRASADSRYFLADVRRTQQVYGPFNLGFYVAGHYATETLLDIDRFRSRGFPFGGAYTPGALSGDSGLEAKLELAYTRHDLEKLKYLKLFTYFTKVKAWNRHPNVGEQFSEVANGIGCGAQAQFNNKIMTSIQYGYPLNNKVGGDGAKPQIGVSMNWQL